LRRPSPSSRPKTPVIYGPDDRFPIGGCKVLRESPEDAAIVIGAGVTVFDALKAYDELKQAGFAVRKSESSWQRTGDCRQRAAGSWQRIADSGQGTGDRGQGTAGSRQRIADSRQLAADSRQT
jgi:hypothetical protein